ncbi:MAG: hypothetical protein ABIC95_03045 [archaeon]
MRDVDLASLGRPGEVPTMQCDNCKKEDQWLEMIGPEFVCHKCINKSRIMGLILRTHMDTFRFLVQKLSVKDYDGLMAVTREQIEAVTDLKAQGIELDGSF